MFFMEIKLETPLSEEVTELRVGDVVYINGRIFTARDRAHKRILERGAPFDIEGSVIFHAGPIIRFDGEPDPAKESIRDPKAELVVVGPTTSGRMNPFQPEVLGLGVRAVIGKGGMDDRTGSALRRYGAVYLAAVGGCAALYGSAVKGIRAVHWLDLGVPEAIWELEVEEFGPLIVAMDSTGRSLYNTEEASHDLEVQKLLD